MRRKDAAKILGLIGRDFSPGATKNPKMQWERGKSGPFQALIGTVLSQRTRDENTSAASERLFSEYPDAQSLSKAPLKKVRALIRQSGFYNVKARRIKEISRIITEKYGGKVPESMEELCSMPGVGRKTAGCVLVYSFGRPAIPADTHVHRVSNRIGIAKTKTPEKTEQELMKAIPEKQWVSVNGLLVSFGKAVCRPVSPRCQLCPVNKYCDYNKNHAH